MPKKFLDSAEIVAGLKQARSKTVPEGMAARMLANAGVQNGPAEVFLDRPVQQMMTPPDVRARIPGKLGGGENVLPGRFLVGIRILSSEPSR